MPPSLEPHNSFESDNKDLTSDSNAQTSLNGSARWINQAVLMVIAAIIGALLSLGVYIIWQEDLQERFGKYLGWIIIAILVLTLCGAIYLIYRLIKLYQVIMKHDENIGRAFERKITKHDETITQRLIQNGETLSLLENTVAKLTEQEQLKIDTLKSLKEIRSISSTFEGMIAKHDEIITQRFEDLISRHDETVTLRFKRMLGEVEEKVEKIEFPKEKFDRLKIKYDVELRPMRLQEYEDLAGFHRVKIGLINGVEESVFATYVIERFSSLPLETDDEVNYFNGNLEALKRMRAKYPDDTKKHGIHRIFIISQDALDNHEKRHEFQSRIVQHVTAGFSITMVRKEDLDDQLRLEFAIFDDEIVFELRIGDSGKGFRKGTIYFDEAIVQSVYKERYREIESRSCSPDKFWSRYHITP